MIEYIPEELISEIKIPTSKQLANREEWRTALKEISRAGINNTKTKSMLRAILADKGLPLSTFSAKNVNECYKLLTEQLSKHYALKEARTTYAEDRFNYFLKRYGYPKRKIYTQHWIGPYNVDFFLPYNRTDKSVGLIIEVGGEMYNNPIKAVKFQGKELYIHEKYKTQLVFLEKTSANYKVADAYVNDFITRKETSTNTLKRLHLKISIDTIACWISSAQLFETRDRILTDCFGLNYDEMIMVIGKITMTKKGKAAKSDRRVLSDGSKLSESSL